MNGVKPLVASILRWIAIFLLVGGLAFIGARQAHVGVEQAIYIGLAAAIPVALGALGWGGFDQARFNQGKPLDSDVTTTPKP